MNLSERIERRNPESKVVPIVERRMPEWRRRAMEQFERVGYVAVKEIKEAA